MEKPHSRKKVTGSGTANLGKGQEVHHNGPSSSARPGASQGRPGASQGRPSYGQGSHSGNSGRGSLGSSLLGALSGAVSTNTYGTSGSGSSSGSSSSSGGGSSLRRIVLIAAVVIVLFLLFRNCFTESSEPDPYDPTISTKETNPTQPIHSDVKNEPRDRYTELRGNGNDDVTVMIYMCGTDLESKYGMATADLQEMINASISKKVNVIVLTGGCQKWQNSTISNTRNQIYKVEDRGLLLLEDDFGASAMTDPNNLTKFVQYCAKYYPASRQALIFWDHGGGTVSGYGYDEKESNSDTMTLSEINSALEQAGTKFEWIGFDACLMATLENALVCDKFADYLIASEESEPGTGWYYTNWLTNLSNDTSMSILSLGKNIIDDFVQASRQSSASSQVTLSLVDLAELHGTLPEAFSRFSISTSNLIKAEDYASVSSARQNTRQFARSSRINQIDLADFATRLNTAESRELASVLRNAIKYNKATMSGANGLSIYFPYENKSSVNSATKMYDDIGMDDDYTECIRSFASLSSGGQIGATAGLGDLFGFGDISSSGGNAGGLLDTVLGSFLGTGSPSSSSGSLLGSLAGSLLGGTSSYGSSVSPIGSLLGSGFSSASPVTSLLGAFTNTSGSASAGSDLTGGLVSSLLGALGGRSMPQELSWMDTDLITDHAEQIEEEMLNPARITVTERNGKKVLSLTEEEWDLVQSVELNVYADDGKGGFIDLGTDNVFTFDGDDLLLDFDRTWITLDGHAVAYYMVSDSENEDGTYTTVGRVPVLLNGQEAELQIVFDDDGYGEVTGATPVYRDGTQTFAKGNIKLSAGDHIQPICDYYKKTDGSYEATYKLGKEFTVGTSGITVENLKLTGAESYQIMFRLTDIYYNQYWTPAITVK